jgi:hypothetical protein
LLVIFDNHHLALKCREGAIRPIKSLAYNQQFLRLVEREIPKLGPRFFLRYGAILLASVRLFPALRSRLIRPTWTPLPENRLLPGLARIADKRCFLLLLLLLLLLPIRSALALRNKGQQPASHYNRIDSKQALPFEFVSDHMSALGTPLDVTLRISKGPTAHLYAFSAFHLRCHMVRPIEVFVIAIHRRLIVNRLLRPDDGADLTPQPDAPDQ